MSQAHLHLARCGRCQQFHERLNLWREKVGAVLPVPVGEHPDSGLLERTLHKSLDTLGSLRQHLADGGTQVKQQAATTCYRAADPTPLAGARPARLRPSSQDASRSGPAPTRVSSGGSTR